MSDDAWNLREMFKASMMLVHLGNDAFRLAL
jgi:hypothetical protein